MRTHTVPNVFFLQILSRIDNGVANIQEFAFSILKIIIMDEVERNNAGVKDKTAVATIGKLGMGTITRFFGKLLLYTCTPQSVYRAQ